MEENKRQGAEQSEEPAGDVRRAQELIARIWALRREWVAAHGQPPSGVVLSPEEYRAVANYGASLGTLNVEALEYLGRHRVFDLTIYVEPGASCRLFSEEAHQAGNE